MKENLFIQHRLFEVNLSQKLNEPTDQFPMRGPFGRRAGKIGTVCGVGGFHLVFIDRNQIQKIQKYVEIKYIRYEKVKQNDWDKTKKSKLVLFAAWPASTWSSQTGIKNKKIKNIEIQYTKKHEKVKQNDRDQTKKVKIALLAILAPSTWSSWTGTKSGLLAFFQISKGVKVLMYLG